MMGWLKRKKSEMTENQWEKRSIWLDGWDKTKEREKNGKATEEKKYKKGRKNTINLSFSVFLCVLYIYLYVLFFLKISSLKDDGLSFLIFLISVDNVVFFWMLKVVPVLLSIQIIIFFSSCFCYFTVADDDGDDDDDGNDENDAVWWCWLSNRKSQFGFFSFFHIRHNFLEDYLFWIRVEL